MRNFLGLMTVRGRLIPVRSEEEVDRNVRRALFNSPEPDPWWHENGPGEEEDENV